MPETSNFCLICLVYSYSQFSTALVECTVSASVLMRNAYHNSNLIFHLGNAFKVWPKNSSIQWCCHQPLYWFILECLWQLVQIFGTIFKTILSRSSFTKPDNIVLVRCRLNLPLKYLSYQVNLSTSTIHATFHKIFGFNVLQAWLPHLNPR